MQHFIGLDAHSQTCTFAIMNSGGEITKVSEVQTNERLIVSFLAQLKGTLFLTFEESFLSKWLFAILRPHVDRLIVCNPTYVTRRGDAKTDRLDAINLARELRAGNLVPVYHVDQNALFELRATVHAYQGLVHQMIQTKNRLKMLYRAEGISFKSQEPYKNAELLEQLRSEAVRMVGRSLYNQLKTLEDGKKTYQRFFEEQARTNKSIFALTSIPGIEATRACIIASLVCDARRFPSKHHFWSYCGLVRHKQISDGVVYGNKKGRGRPELKGLFHGASITVQVSYKHSSLHQYFENEQRKGSNVRDARVALARKIASIALSVMRTELTYRPEDPKTYRFKRNSKCFNS